MYGMPQGVYTGKCGANGLQLPLCAPVRYYKQQVNMRSEYKSICCSKTVRQMPVAQCYDLYVKLQPFLAVYSCGSVYHVPQRPFSKKDSHHSDWPLHWFGGDAYHRESVCLRWFKGNTTPALRPTFQQFCRAYAIEPVGE